MIQEFAQWIENETAWVIGTSLFVAELPIRRSNGSEVPERCVLLAEDGPAAVDGYLPDRVDQEIQIWNRAADYWTARTDAYALYVRLHGRQNLWLPVLTSGDDYLVMVVDAVAAPSPIAKPNAKGLYEFSTNYILRTADPYA
jgi:hypothetical protein